MKEKDLKAKIIKYLNSLPNTFSFSIEQRPGQARGVSDILCCRGGVFIGIECKIPGNKTTALQDRFLGKIREAGGIAVVAYGIEEFKDELF